MSNTEEILEQFGKKARENVNLTTKEKELHRQKFLQFMENNSHAENTEEVQTESEFQPFFFNFFKLVKPVYLILPLLIIVGSTGIVMAAQRALPGSPLYSLKTEFLEKIQTDLATSPEEKAQVNMNLATRRLTEADALVKQNQLTPEISRELTDLFEEKGKELEKALVTLQEDQKDNIVRQVNQEFSTALKEHKDTLSTLHRVNATAIQSSMRPQKISFPKANLESKK